MLRQQTFYVNSEKIVIKSRNVSSSGNPNGFNIWINDRKYYCNFLEREKAIDHCFVQWNNEESKK